jgi:hypothetical protein
MKIRDYEQRLLESYIASFPKLDEMVLFGYGVLSPELQLASGEIDPYDRKIWRPMRMETDPRVLEPIMRNYRHDFRHFMSSWCLRIGGRRSTWTHIAFWRILLAQT